MLHKFIRELFSSLEAVKRIINNDDSKVFDNLNMQDKRVLNDCIEIATKYEVNVRFVINGNENVICRTLTNSYLTVDYGPNWRKENNYRELVNKEKQKLWQNTQ